MMLHKDMSLNDIVSYCVLCNEHSIKKVLVEHAVFDAIKMLIFPMPIELPVMGVVFKVVLHHSN
jgi:hypothetical protein